VARFDAALVWVRVVSPPGAARIRALRPMTVSIHTSHRVHAPALRCSMTPRMGTYARSAAGDGCAQIQAPYRTAAVENNLLIAYSRSADKYITLRFTCFVRTG
jgi:hypothetical protein